MQNASVLELLRKTCPRRSTAGMSVWGIAPRSSIRDSNCKAWATLQLQPTAQACTSRIGHVQPCAAYPAHTGQAHPQLRSYPMCLYHFFQVHSERPVSGDKHRYIRPLVQNEGQRLDRWDEPSRGAS